ncbi:MAG: N-acetyltransferase [Alphaproteobacteria bacterium]|nr:N-acetyltransferase [Alphaproteobacteria bacterium]
METTPAPVVRDARDTDIATIRDIYAEHVLTGLASFEEVPPDAAEMLRRMRETRANGLPYLVAALAGDGQDTVRGFAYASRFRTRSAYRYTVEDSVYIAGDMIGRGLGNVLLGTLIARCTALGYRQMIAVIGDSGNAASIGLHAHHGFANIGTMPAVGFKFGRWVDSVRMQRALGPGSSSPPDDATGQD